MAIHRLNHAVLYVRDLARTVAFYTDVLGFTVKFELAGQAAFFRAPGSTNDHDLGVFALGNHLSDTTAGRSSVGLYHLAWEVDTLAELVRIEGVLRDKGALVGSTDHGSSKSIYAKDVDGIEFEVAWWVPADRMDDEVIEARKRLRPLDLGRELARYGADTRGGVGITHAV
jgi:catechol-2,3-dioxygenase